MRRSGSLPLSTFLVEVEEKAKALGALGLDTSLDALEGSAHQQFLMLADAAAARGLQFKVRSTRRTCAQQADLYATGRQPNDARAIVTHARGCTSWHVTGRAVDVTMTAGSYADFGALAKSMGWKWGGDFPGFPDVGHVEWHPGMTTADVCPNPAVCVDTAVDTTVPSAPPTGGSPAEEPSFALPAALAAVAFGAIVWSRT